jgi:iron complex outermembrane receptor protein
VPDPEGRQHQAGLRIDHPGDPDRRQANLGPETSKQGNLGVVWEPLSNLSMNADLWEIRKETRSTRSAGDHDRQLRPVRGTSSCVTRGNLWRFIDQRWVNAGERITRGLELGARTNGKLGTASGPPASTVRACWRRSRAPPRPAPFGERSRPLHLHRRPRPEVEAHRLRDLQAG